MVNCVGSGHSLAHALIIIHNFAVFGPIAHDWNTIKKWNLLYSDKMLGNPKKYLYSDSE